MPGRQRNLDEFQERREDDGRNHQKDRPLRIGERKDKSDESEREEMFVAMFHAGDGAFRGRNHGSETKPMTSNQAKARRKFTLCFAQTPGLRSTGHSLSFEAWNELDALGLTDIQSRKLSVSLARGQTEHKTCLN